ncbi:MAG: hypothetical protein ABIM30_09980 [candidate division WOR-3 bacterium]
MMFQLRVFQKARIQSTHVALFLFLLAITSFLGCRKEIVEGQEDLLNYVQYRNETTPTLTHGMLHFDSFADLNEFVKSLQDKEADTAQVRSAYIALGVDVNAEYLPNLTDYPICLIKEQSIGGYTSARKAEETVVNAALNNGDDNVNSIILFPYWKTALNEDYSIHVGTRIYKYYENGGIAIILNNDWTQYESVKTQTFENLRESFNLIVTSDTREGWEQYFTFNSDESIQEEKPIFIPRFAVETAADGKFSISNISLVETKAGASTYQWIYSDNTTSTGQNPNRSIGLTENVMLIINNGMGKVDTLSSIESILACSTEHFTITYLSTNQIRFELPGYISGNPTNFYNLVWVFSDGSTSTNNPVIKTFTSNGTATCQAWRVSDNTLACEFTKPFTVKCGDKKSVSSTRTFNYCDQRWKLDGSIWVQSGEVGCRVKYLRWRGAILGWQPANNQGACADLSGTYIREVYNPNKNCIDVAASGSHCLGNGTWPTSVSHTIAEVPNVFSKPGQLSAGLGIKVCGVWHGWGFGGSPRLVLP